MTGDINDFSRLCPFCVTSQKRVEFWGQYGYSTKEGRKCWLHSRPGWQASLFGWLCHVGIASSYTAIFIKSPLLFEPELNYDCDENMGHNIGQDVRKELFHLAPPFRETYRRPVYSKRADSARAPARGSWRMACVAWLKGKYGDLFFDHRDRAPRPLCLMTARRRKAGPPGFLTPRSQSEIRFIVRCHFWKKMLYKRDSSC